MSACQSRRSWLLLAVGALACSSSPSDAPADAGTCAERIAASSAAVQEVLGTANQSCSTDSDCKITYLGTDCWHGCGAALSDVAQQALDRVVDEQNRTTCAGFVASGCFAEIPPCVSPGLAACLGGECSTFQGYATADGAASKAPLELSIAASGTSVELAIRQRLDLKLQTIGPGNYGDPQLSSPALRFAQSLYPHSQNPGGPTQIYVFQADSAGQTEITIPHTVRTEPFKLTVTIR